MYTGFNVLNGVHALRALDRTPQCVQLFLVKAIRKRVSGGIEDLIGCLANNNANS